MQISLTFKFWQLPLHNVECTMSDDGDIQMGKKVEEIIIRRFYYSDIIRLDHLLVVRGLMG